VASLAIVVVVVGSIELVAGLWLLRPALLGHRAAFHTAARPVRQVLHSGSEPRGAAGSEDPSWRRVVSDLIQSEFRLQARPGDAELDAVYVPDTPLYRKVETHNDNLAKVGLRVTGRSPRVRSVKAVSGRSTPTLAVTVDHPERRLVDGEGNVVGVRKSERRSEVLWLSAEADGSYRIAESVELGSVPLNEGGFQPDQADAVSLNSNSTGDGASPAAGNPPSERERDGDR
jgi:hypothetical protein